MASSDFVNPLSEVGKVIASDLYGGIKKWFAKLDPGGSKLEDYHSGLLSSFGHIQIMGMAAPRRLQNIYVGLRAAPDMKKYTREVGTYHLKPDVERNVVTARKFLYSRQNIDIDKFISDLGYDVDADEDALHSLMEIAPKKTSLPVPQAENIEKRKQRHVLDFVNKYQKLVILGGPGSGKTTLLKYLALVYSGHLQAPAEIDYLLPVFVPLREVKRAGPPLPTADWLRDFAVSCAGDVSTKTFAKEWLEDALAKGRCLVLLDGVDEAPVALLSTLFQSIRAFSTKYRGNSIIVTCRVAAFDRSLEGFQICEIDNFTHDDIKLFVRQWYETDPNSADGLIGEIFRSMLAIDLCTTPLLLTLICVLHGYRRTIPANRAELYEACVDAMLFRWDTFRSVDRDPLILEPIGPDRKKLLLSRVAFRAFDRDIMFFKKESLLELIQAELDYLDLSAIPSDGLLKEIESHSGLLVEYAPQVYCFSHLTFHEFFTAYYYYDTKDYAELFNKTIAQPRYLEIFLMCLEKVYNADQLVMQLISHVTNKCVRENEYDEYVHLLVRNVRLCSAVINHKLQAVLRELDLKLEQLSIDDQSVVRPSSRGRHIER